MDKLAKLRARGNTQSKVKQKHREKPSYADVNEKSLEFVSYLVGGYSNASDEHKQSVLSAYNMTEEQLKDYEQATKQ